MTTTTTLSIPAGGQAGPFDLYSDVDDYTVAFAEGILPATMIAGYTSSDVPNGTNFIRVQSTNTCENYIDIPITEEKTINGQTFLNKNADTTVYADGTEIPYVEDATAWANLSTGAWCYYNNDPANGPIYGKLYNWWAVVDPRGLAPNGWHVPTLSEYQALLSYLYSNAGGELKATGTLEAGTGLWKAPNEGATNETGFTALPGGYRSDGGGFGNIGEVAEFWTVTPYVYNPQYEANNLVLFDSSNGALISEINKGYGLSVRFIKNSI